MLIHSNICGNTRQWCILSPLNEGLKCKIVAIATVSLLTALHNLDYAAQNTPL